MLPLGDEYVPVIVNLKNSEEIRVRWSGADENEIKDVISHVLSMDVKYTEFLNSISQYPELLRIAEKYGGLRPMRNISIYEALLKVIPQQMISLKAALNFTGKLIKEMGVVKEVESRKFYSVPEPEVIISKGIFALLKIGTTKMKARAILEVAKLQHAEKLPDLKSINENPKEAIKELMTIKGIGRWTAELSVATVIRDYSIAPAGDLNVKKGFKRILNIESESEIRKFVENLGKWRGLAMYLIAQELNSQNPSSS